MPRKAFICLVFTCLTILLRGEGFVASSLHDFEARYPLELGEQQIFPAEKLPLLREKPDIYLVSYETEEETHIVGIRKYDESGRRLAFHQTGTVQVTTTYFADFSEAFILISKGVAYPVLEGDDQTEQITIEAGRPTSSFPLKVPSRLFQVSSVEELRTQEALAAKVRSERISERATSLGEVTAGGYTLTSSSVNRHALREVNDEFQAWNLAVESTADDIHSVPLERYLEAPLEALCHIRSPSGRGSGFLVAMDSRVYVATNIHVILSPDPFEIVTTNGEKLEILKIELARDRDLARISIKGPAHGLPSSTTVNIGDDIIAYGDSGGAGVMTGEVGQILGVSYDDLEISAGIVRGNSGGPIVKGKNLVVGISSRVERDLGPSDWVKDGTRYGNIRRYAVRISDSIEWVPVHEEALQAMDQHLDDVYHTWALQSLQQTLNQYVSYPMGTLSESKTGNQNLDSWKRQHNLLIGEYRAKLRLHGRLEQKLQFLEGMRGRTHAVAKALVLTSRENADSLNALEIVPEVEFVEQLRRRHIDFWESQAKVVESALPAILQRIDREIDRQIQSVKVRLKRKARLYR